MERIPRFDRSVYAVARGIAPGNTLTYGEVAARLPADSIADAASLAQAVGASLGRNPYAIIVPCHRAYLPPAARLAAFQRAAVRRPNCECSPSKAR